tara:strand:- start:461 stop:1081 length:621 start_codon:yes stop_codon:yes gene_type:complete
MEEELEKYWLESKNFKIQQKKPEWVSFIKEVYKDGKINNTLEIGCYDGGTTISLANITKNLITIDQPIKPRFDVYQYNVGDKELFGTELLNTKTNFKYVGGNSHSEEIYNKTFELLNGEKLDLLFIDGDHTYEGVKSDFYQYKSLVKPNGIIALHDVHNSDFHEKHGCFVHNFWDEVKDKYEHKVFYDNTQYHEWGGIGLIINKEI